MIILLLVPQAFCTVFQQAAAVYFFILYFGKDLANACLKSHDQTLNYSILVQVYDKYRLYIYGFDKNTIFAKVYIFQKDKTFLLISFLFPFLLL